ncbi:lipoprotein, partial [Acinetobacter baumannii]
MKKIIVISTILLGLTGCAIPAVNNLVRSTNMYQDEIA